MKRNKQITLICMMAATATLCCHPIAANAKTGLPATATHNSQQHIAAEIESYFGNTLAGNATSPVTNRSISTSDIGTYQKLVWDAWQKANKTLTEERLIPLQDLGEAKTGQWHLPQQLEPNAVMNYYYGKKTAKDATKENSAHAESARLPFFLYLHGSGPKAQEWATGLKLAQWFNDAPSVYFIPQIPNEGNYYRWWQKSKQWAWDKLLRQTLLNDEIDANRIYIFGISEGGYGSQRMASFYADYLAAAGPMAGGEPLRNAPVENCANIGFSFLTGADDMAFFRNKFTQDAKQAFDSLQALHPDQFKHRIELIPGRAHHIDYSPTTPWLSGFTRNPYPKQLMWEDFDMDGQYRRGFYNIRVNERQQLDPMSRTYYTMDIADNVVRVDVQTVSYEILQRDPYWHSIEMAFKRHYTPADKYSFTIFLNDKLVDLNRKVTVIVNGKKKFHGRLKPQLNNMIESVTTFYDPCRIYPAAVKIKN